MEIKPYHRRAQYHETDQMAVIHHSNYIKWFEEARVDFMEQTGYGYERSVEEGVDFAVLGITCDYRSMVRFGEEVDILCSITLLTASRMTVRYTVTDAATGTLRTTGESRHAYVDGATKRPVSLKKRLPELYEMFTELVAAEPAE